MMTRTGFDEFMDACIECALWSSTDNSDDTGGEPLDYNYTEDDIHPESLNKIREDCHKFYSQWSHKWADCQDCGEWTIDEQAGHDFWLTRNGHGAGFWGRGDLYPEGVGDELTTACQHQEVDLYVGDDGMLHMS